MLAVPFRAKQCSDSVEENILHVPSFNNYAVVSTQGVEVINFP